MAGTCQEYLKIMTSRVAQYVSDFVQDCSSFEAKFLLKKWFSKSHFFPKYLIQACKNWKKQKQNKNTKQKQNNIHAFAYFLRLLIRNVFEHNSHIDNEFYSLCTCKPHNIASNWQN